MKSMFHEKLDEGMKKHIGQLIAYIHEAIHTNNVIYKILYFFDFIGNNSLNSNLLLI